MNLIGLLGRWLNQYKSGVACSEPDQCMVWSWAWDSGDWLFHRPEANQSNYWELGNFLIKNSYHSTRVNSSNDTGSTFDAIKMLSKPRMTSRYSAKKFCELYLCFSEGEYLIKKILGKQVDMVSIN